MNKTSVSVSAVLTLAILSGESRAGLIVNGDFEAGNTGFTSSYRYVVPGGSSLWPESVYTVDTNPKNSHSLFYSMGDHTTGSGSMMIINGSSTTGIPVWQGTVDSDLTVGESYDFSSWAASAYPDSVARLTFSVDDVPLGMFSPTADGSWSLLSASFIATEARPVFKLINSNGDYHGNDFAIDDIDVVAQGPTFQFASRTSSVPDGGVGIAGLAMLVGMFAIQRRQKNKRQSEPAG